ncbi:MAG: hypothetical protein K2J77_09925 [Oscillospiraceae bacterium]|nr:hypothetical protein [Oscillospiraceae bacterium]
MEKLVALCYLWAFGLGNKDDYFSELDRLFLESPEDDFLLELEGFGDDSAAALTRLSPLIEGSLNVDAFGRELLSRLEKFYLENCNSISALEEFGKMCYGMWKSFPANIDDQPFLTLAYADDPLSWGDEKQSRELYQKAFEHYKG